MRVSGIRTAQDQSSANTITLRDRSASTSANTAGFATRSTQRSSGACSRICPSRNSVPSSGAFRHSSACPPGARARAAAA